jgi:hypothetical protein
MPFGATLRAQALSTPEPAVNSRPSYSTGPRLRRRNDLRQQPQKITLTAEFDEFGSKAYRAIALNLDINIQSGIYLFQKGEPGPVLGMTYIEYVEVDGREMYH